MHLDGYAKGYALQRDVRAGTVEQLLVAVGVFSRWLGRSALLSDLVDDRVNRWLAWMLTEGRSRETVRSKRRAILTLWCQAWRDGLIAQPPAKVRRVAVPESVPRAWSHEDIRRLLARIDGLRGEFKTLKIPRRIYWRSFVNAKYDTALRAADLRSLERSWVQGGAVSIVQRKVGRVHRVPLRPSTMAEIDECMAALPGRRLIWPLFCCERNWFRAFRQIVLGAGLTGSAKWLRRSSASYVERDNPGMAWVHLGHSRPGLDRRHYVDPSIAERPLIMPPEIE